ncbi:hypothetical protein DEDE109153_07445 [Deinococcus deserti]|uniref:Flagellar assembly protein T N-terminal domain-containing protein n=1 Tax=Deinococcus deserti (strain DSM 17065 / CIP 109153 / LMG 22923 / VCD115) TaxID=546414 RepID=C1CWI4_DEIDV|nr:hypothetical protein [Deinococcus deserti]ACO46551.1 conserved hypothetical protein, precursor [Deinococcus deserti VCD115]
MNWEIVQKASVAALALSSGALAQGTSERLTLDIEVTGQDRDRAYAQAMEKGIEALVSRNLTPGTAAYTQVLRDFPRADVRLGRILREQTVAGQVYMTVQVSVPRGAVERAAVRALPAVAQTRIAVVIPEVILRRPVPDPAAETEIARGLISSGLRVVDASQQVTNALREMVRANPTLSGTAAAELRTRLNTDLLVTGEAFAEEYGSVAGGLRGYTARLEVKVIDLASGQLLHSQAFQGSAVGATDAVAGKTALMNVGKIAADVLPGIVLKALQGSGSAAQRAFVVRVAPPVTFTQVNALMARLKTNVSLQDLTVRTIDAAGASLEIPFGGSVLELAALLESAGMQVVGMTGAELTLKF